MIHRTETQKENINKVLDLISIKLENNDLARYLAGMSPKDSSNLLFLDKFDYNYFMSKYVEVMQENLSLTNCHALQTIEKNFELLKFAGALNCSNQFFIEFIKKEMNYKNWE